MFLLPMTFSPPPTPPPSTIRRSPTLLGPATTFLWLPPILGIASLLIFAISATFLYLLLWIHTFVNVNIGELQIYWLHVFPLYPFPLWLLVRNQLSGTEMRPITAAKPPPPPLWHVPWKLAWERELGYMFGRQFYSSFQLPSKKRAGNEWKRCLTNWLGWFILITPCSSNIIAHDHNRKIK